MIHDTFLRVREVEPEAVGILPSPEYTGYIDTVYSFRYHLPFFRGKMPTWGAGGFMVLGQRGVSALDIQEEGLEQAHGVEFRGTFQIEKTDVMSSDRNFRTRISHNSLDETELPRDTSTIARLCIREGLAEYKDYTPYKEYMAGARFLMSYAFGRARSKLNLALSRDRA